MRDRRRDPSHSGVDAFFSCRRSKEERPDLQGNAERWKGIHIRADLCGNRRRVDGVEVDAANAP